MKHEIEVKIDQNGEKMKLWQDRMPYALPEENFEPSLIPMLVDGAKTAIIVCPGGGYYLKAEHEGMPVAKWLNSIGVSAFVLDYRIHPNQAPAPAADVQRAMRLVRKIASEQNITNIGIMGFSAGGHLAGTASVHYDFPFYEPMDEIDSLSARPDFSVLCYSVIDMMEYREYGTSKFLLGDRPAKKEKEFYSLHLHVTENTPPAFLWHTASDSTVPVESALLYGKALSECKVPWELHVYPFGEHGLGMAENDAHVNQWLDALANWLKVMYY